VVAIDAAQRCVKLADGGHLEYDSLSLDVGSETDSSWLAAAGERLLPVKPLSVFVQRWSEIVEAAQQQGYCLLVVGGGC